MADRSEVHPHHLLRAVLADRLVRGVLAGLGVAADEVLLTLDRRWLAAADTLDLEDVAALGIDLPTVLGVLNPPYAEPADWQGRHLTDPARAVLVRALAVRGTLQGPRVAGTHLLLSLMTTRDPLVSGTLRAHGLHTRSARGFVVRSCRRAS